MAVTTTLAAGLKSTSPSYSTPESKLNLTCENHLREYENANKISSGFYIIEPWSPDDGQYLTKKTLKAAIDQLKQAKHKIKPYPPIYYGNAKDIFKPLKSYSYSYGFSTKLKSDSTVLDRIKHLIECGEKLVYEAEKNGKTPCDETLAKFDKALKELREDGK